jgi:NAD(P)-dependent dehydrogenase (short-subunit alcohol dehydrogenase family)
MQMLVNGGASYIGLHTCLRLWQSGTEVTVVDNFCNSSPEAMNRVQALSERSLNVVHGDVRDAALSTSVRKYKDVIALTARHEEALLQLGMHAIRRCPPAPNKAARKRVSSTSSAPLPVAPSQTSWLFADQETYKCSTQTTHHSTSS